MLGKTTTHDLAQRLGGVGLKSLRQPRGRRPGTHDHVTTVSRLNTRKDSEECRLAGTIGSNQPEPFSRIDYEGDVFQNDLGAIVFRDVYDLEHPRSSVAT